MKMPTQKQLVQMYSRVTILQKIVTLQHIYSLYLAAQQSKPPRKSVSFNILQLQKMINNSPLINPNFDFLNMKESLNHMRQKKQKGKTTESVLSAIQIVQVIAETLAIQGRDGKNISIISQVPKTTVFMLTPKITITFVRDRLIKILNNYKSNTLKDITALEMNYKRKIKEISLMEKGEISDKDLREEFTRTLRHSKEIEEQQNAVKYPDKDNSEKHSSKALKNKKKASSTTINKNEPVGKEAKGKGKPLVTAIPESKEKLPDHNSSPTKVLRDKKSEKRILEADQNVSDKASSSEPPSSVDSDSALLKDSKNLERITDSARAVTIDQQSQSNEESAFIVKEDAAEKSLVTCNVLPQSSLVPTGKSMAKNVSEIVQSASEEKQPTQNSLPDANICIEQKNDNPIDKKMEQNITKEIPVESNGEEDQSKNKNNKKAETIKQAEIQSGINTDKTDKSTGLSSSLSSPSDDDEEGSMVDASLPPTDLAQENKEDIRKGVNAGEKCKIVTNKKKDSIATSTEKNDNITNTKSSEESKSSSPVVIKPEVQIDTKSNGAKGDSESVAVEKIVTKEDTSKHSDKPVSEISGKVEKVEKVGTKDGKNEFKKESKEEVESNINTKKRSRSTSSDQTRQRKKFQALSVQFLSQISSNRFASMFLHPVNAQEEPNYYELIKRPVDLRTLTKDIRTGAVTSFEELEFLLQLMFSNAVMYNDMNQEEVYSGIISMMEESDRLLTMFKETIGGGSD